MFLPFDHGLILWSHLSVWWHGSDLIILYRLTIMPYDPKIYLFCYSLSEWYLFHDNGNLLQGNFSQIFSYKVLQACSCQSDMGVFHEFKVWPMLQLCRHPAFCNITLCCTMLEKDPTTLFCSSSPTFLVLCCKVCNIFLISSEPY